MSKHVMIDIETLATASNAAIVSIGACTFHLGHDGDLIAGDETFIVGVDPDYYDLGAGHSSAFCVDPETVRWWGKQSKEARDSLKINQASTLPLALDQMTAWFEDVSFERDNAPYHADSPRVWANPPSFDLVIIRNGCKHAYGSTEDVPWHYRQETCCRTHSYMAPFLSKGARVALTNKDLIAHRADHDAVRQARIVQYIENRR